MKRNSWNFIILLAFLLCFWSVSSAPTRNTNLFNLQSRTIKFNFEYAEVARQIPQFEMSTLETVKYNRSTPVLNAEFVVHDKAVMNYKVWVDGFQQFGMEHIYRRSAIALHSSFCDLISGSYLLNRGMSQYGNIPSKCPLKVGQVYFLRNFNIEASPIVLPGNKWRWDFQVGPEGKKDTNDTLLLKIYFKVDRFNLKTPA